jgi:mono/diheme cytochrome c family protein
VRQALYFLYPKVSQPGDFWGSDQSPNLLGTERTGPDLSQESGWHPDDWQRAHFYDPRFVDPMSLMPDMKSLFSDAQIEHLIAYVEQRSGKSGLLRYAGQLYSKHVVLVNQGFPEPYTGFQGAHKPIVKSNDASLKPPSTQLEEAPNLSQIDRSYWLSGNPLPVTTENLNRGKEVFLQRCVGCHGLKGTARGRRFVHVAAAGRLHRQGRRLLWRRHRAWRLLLPHPARLAGTAMENFGDRLSVDDIWRVVLFVKTIPNGTLNRTICRRPTTTSSGSRRRSCSRGSRRTSSLRSNVSFDKVQSRDPYVQEAMRVFPGPRTR